MDLQHLLSLIISLLMVMLVVPLQSRLRMSLWLQKRVTLG